MTFLTGQNGWLGQSKSDIAVESIPCGATTWQPRERLTANVFVCVALKGPSDPNQPNRLGVCRVWAIGRHHSPPRSERARQRFLRLVGV